ncbi:Na-translocating system protein MpsC family protein [Zavarzinella formosa]|uniref:Na-translocating system protein MpsC family protein n=1 Tax=Zavarzinella formosa TaxID=360055 RepID=UPI0002E0B1FC|nr:Na-translocating system protein MpsC family protein [Zavarzinella formosa]
MDKSQENIGEKIARAARDSEKRHTSHGREWAAVFMIEDTVVIALHGSLTDEEKSLVRSPAGAARVREFHRRLFADVTDGLAGRIRRITGMKIRDKTSEIDLASGSVAQIFTTKTVLAESLFAPREIVGKSGRRSSETKTGNAANLIAETSARATSRKDITSVATAVQAGKHMSATGRQAMSKTFRQR